MNTSWQTAALLTWTILFSHTSFGNESKAPTLPSKKTTEQKPAEPKKSYRDMLPSTDGSDVVAEEDVADKNPAIKNGQSSQPKNVEDPSKVKSPSSQRKVTVGVQCTDTAGKVYSDIDAGYSSCLQQTSEKIQAQKDGGAQDGRKPTDGKTSVGPSVNLKIGN